MEEISTELKKAFGFRIQEIRRRKKLTQEKLAEMIGMDIPNISNIERGKRFVSYVTLDKIIKALDITPKELFDFEHIQSREVLLKQINDIILNSTDKQLEYYYRMMKIYQEY